MAEPIWQVGGKWSVSEDNGFLVLLDVNQTGHQIEAACSHSNGNIRSRAARGFLTNLEFQL